MFTKEEKVGNTKNERPVWTDCGFTGHIADKCFMATHLVISQKESSQQIKFPAIDLLEIALLPMPALGILETLFLNQPLILLILLR